MTAECILPSEVLSIESRYLRKKMEEDPKMGMQIMRKLIFIYYNRLNQLRKEIANFFKVFKVKAP